MGPKRSVEGGKKGQTLSNPKTGEGEKQVKTGQKKNRRA